MQVSGTSVVQGRTWTLQSTLLKSGTLGRWVNKQRTQYRLFKEGIASSMTDERVRKLELIGFQWSVMKRSRNISAMQPPSTASDAPYWLKQVDAYDSFWILFCVCSFIDIFIIYHISYERCRSPCVPSMYRIQPPNRHCHRPHTLPSMFVRHCATRVCAKRGM